MFSGTIKENIIRSCSVDIESVGDQKEEYYKIIYNTIDCAEGMKHGIKDELKKYLEKEIRNSIIGCNRKVKDIISRMISTIKESCKKDSCEGDAFCAGIFLYGEEGVGKDIFSKIFHIVNPRCCECTCTNNYLERGLISINSAALNNDATAFREILFGKAYNAAARRIEGTIDNISKKRGTLFFDEIDKLKIPLANELLRVIESPHTYRRVGDSDIKYANLFVVFASNTRLPDMLKNGFSRAFVFRIGANAFEIPPLRERPEDIALFFAHEIKKRNDEEGFNIRKIQHEGLRLLCELPWPDNYRGLKSFIRDLFLDRKIRGIGSNEITYEEVLQVIGKRELLRQRVT